MIRYEFLIKSMHTQQMTLEVLFRAAASGDEKAVTKMLAQHPPLFDKTNASFAWP